MEERVAIGESGFRIVPFIIMLTILGAFAFAFWRFQRHRKLAGNIIYPEFWN